MNIIVDEGNTRIKLAAFEGDDLVFRQVFSAPEWLLYEGPELIRTHPFNVLISSVRGTSPVLPLWSSDAIHRMALPGQLHLPLRIEYQTPDTLGADRIANAAGALKKYGNNCLIIDCGTCITTTYVGDQTLKGGSISPGIQMRFKALHDYTGNLPLLDMTEEVPALLGKTTQESIYSGVILGVLRETEGSIENWLECFTIEHIVLTGGDASFFAGQLKRRTFADADLTLYGLNEILKYNLEYK
jgi:type III pantothenate kinase